MVRKFGNIQNAALILKAQFVREIFTIHRKLGAVKWVQNYPSYSAMQLVGNRFCGVVVLGSFNMVYGHEDSVLDQKILKRF